MLEININTAYALALSFIVVIAIGPWLIPQLHKLKFGQSIREEGPKSHQAKSGTPTMGGIMIIIYYFMAYRFIFFFDFYIFK